MQEIKTRSLGLNEVTAEPICSTMPTPSWPKIRPNSQVGTSPLRMCRSVPQIVVLVIFTIASVGAEIFGLGRSLSAFRPGPSGQNLTFGTHGYNGGFRPKVSRSAGSHSSTKADIAPHGWFTAQPVQKRRLVADGRTAGFVFDASVRKLAHDICVRHAYE